MSTFEIILVSFATGFVVGGSVIKYLSMKVIQEVYEEKKEKR